MKYEHPLKKILSQARPYWDRQEMRVGVRTVFSKALQCRTPELGAEVYASENQELILYHTCKSRACPSCGYRATAQWLRERWAALPAASYKGITFTMPNQLWPLVRNNPPLADALSALAAELIQARVSAKYGLRVGVVAILHTFNGKLEFNSHVHTTLGERFTSGPQLKVELLETFPSVKPHSFNASNCHYSDRKRAGSTYFDGVVLGGRNS
ncbi:MAG: transposase zinc-binding domain-containing protein [Terriglobales bacterium]|jgi:hypothetical protein